jgi:hypothetical protein
MVTVSTHGSLMTSDIEYLFLHLLPSVFFGEVFIRILCSFLIELFVLLLLNVKASLYILDVRLLSMGFANTFSHSVVFPFIFLTEIFNFYELQLFSSHR